MNNTGLEILAFISIFYLLQIVVYWDNYRYMRLLPSDGTKNLHIKVSILIPARNEEKNLEKCLNSLVTQNFPDFEILVLDDESEDKTWEILQQFESKYENFSAIKGKPIPSGWLGKPWACHQLSLAATGDIFMFTDADTIHNKNNLNVIINKMHQQELAFVSILPKEIVVTWGEKLAVPILHWFVSALLSLRLAYKLPYSFLAAANGQCLYFKKSAYLQIGGHKAIRTNILDDFSLVKNIKNAKFNWALFDGVGLVSCRMYHNYEEVKYGLGKNLFHVFGKNLIWFCSGWGVILFVVLYPWVLAGSSFNNPIILVACTGVITLSYIPWWHFIKRFDFPNSLLHLYPLVLITGFGLAINSVIQSFKKKSTWKGRDISNY